MTNIGLLSDLKLRIGNIGDLILLSGTRFYYWDPTSTATSDDLNTVQVTGLTTGRWVLIILKGLIPIVVTASTQQLVPNTEYIADSSSLITFTLPIESNTIIGDRVIIRGKGIGLWKIAQNASQIIHALTNTTAGTAGSIQSQSRYDNITLEKIASNEWVVINSFGTFTIV